MTGGAVRPSFGTFSCSMSFGSSASDTTLHYGLKERAWLSRFGYQGQVHSWPCSSLLPRHECRGGGCRAWQFCEELPPSSFSHFAACSDLPRSWFCASSATFLRDHVTGQAPRAQEGVATPHDALFKRSSHSPATQPLSCAISCHQPLVNRSTGRHWRWCLAVSWIRSTEIAMRTCSIR